MRGPPIATVPRPSATWFPFGEQKFRHDRNRRASQARDRLTDPNPQPCHRLGA
jgi:hypothetical protein